MNDRRDRDAEGMTLIELLVSLGVLAVISVAFATILSQSQRVVNRSNALMRANATASAVSQIIRDDLTRLCPQGFLAVHDATPTDINNNLVLTSVGPFTSLTNPTLTANAARIEYGWTDNGSTDPNDHLIWRRAMLLTGTTLGATDINPDDDRDEATWLGAYDTTPGTALIAVDPLLDGFCANPTQAIPRDQNLNAGNLGDLWPLLARPVTAFRVYWWDPGPPPAWSSANQVWTATQFAAGTGPAAIKVTFTLKTGAKAGEELDCEVVCPLRQ